MFYSSTLNALRKLRQAEYSHCSRSSSLETEQDFSGMFIIWEILDKIYIW